MKGKTKPVVTLHTDVATILTGIQTTVDIGTASAMDAVGAVSLATNNAPPAFSAEQR